MGARAKGGTPWGGRGGDAWGKKKGPPRRVIWAPVPKRGTVPKPLLGERAAQPNNLKSSKWTGHWTGGRVVLGAGVITITTIE